MKKISVLMGLIFILVAASTSFGALIPVVGNSNRPLVLGSGDPPSLFGSGGALVGKADPTQLQTDYFNPAMPGAPPYVSEFSLQFEVAGNNNVNQLSLYSYSDPTKELIVFNGADSPTTNSVVHFVWDGSSWTLTSVKGIAIIVDTETFATPTFGFVLQNMNTGGAKFYGDDELNSNNAPQMLVFNSINPAEGYWFAFEDLPYYGGSDQDFNDMVFHAQSIEPVPEPGTMLLLGSGLVGLAGWGRKKFRK